MGIEKIPNNGAVSYQGSANTSDRVGVSNAGTTSQTFGNEASVSVAETQNFSLDARDDGNGIEECASNNNKQLQNAVNDLNKRMKNSEAIFGIHDKTNRVTIKIVDKKTREVIKEYPPEETLDMIAKIWEIAGILVDEKR